MNPLPYCGAAETCFLAQDLSLVRLLPDLFGRKARGQSADDLAGLFEKRAFGSVSCAVGAEVAEVILSLRLMISH